LIFVEKIPILNVFQRQNNLPKYSLQYYSIFLIFFLKVDEVTITKGDFVAHCAWAQILGRGIEQKHVRGGI
jgi:hypothetical protein